MERKCSIAVGRFQCQVSVPFFLSKENKKFQITKVAANARSREYVGCVD